MKRSIIMKNTVTGQEYVPGDMDTHYYFGVGAKIRETVSKLCPEFFAGLEKSIGQNPTQQMTIVSENMAKWSKNMAEWVGRWVVTAKNVASEGMEEKWVVDADEWKAKLKLGADGWLTDDNEWKKRRDDLRKKEWLNKDKAKFDTLGIPSKAFYQIFWSTKNPIGKLQRFALVCGFVMGKETDMESFTRDILNNAGITIVSVNDDSHESGSGRERDKAQSIIFYGVPGSGKSYAIKGRIGEVLGYDDVEDNEEFDDHYKDLLEHGHIRRVVFHPDYTYSDFTGQILPVTKENDGVVYEFKPGPFTEILTSAIKEEDEYSEPFFLIIEEINRGNAASIFGDLFQLLDRDETGKSEYPVDNREIGKIVHGVTNDKDKIYIPSNLWLLATMNTSDQNVFTLDTAFQRRWSMELIPNKFDRRQEFLIEDTEVTWRKFAEAVNEKLEDSNEMMSGDKRLGAWFVKADDKDVISKGLFANKVLKYLWDDAFKFNRDKFFNTTKYKTLEKVIDTFTNSIMGGNGGFGELFHNSITFGVASASKNTEESGE
jgi:MoxR-like ATPase